MARALLTMGLSLGVLVALVPGEASTAESPTLTVPFVPDHDVIVDGRVLEDAWQQARVIDEFHNHHPRDEGRAEVETVVRVFYDRHALFFKAQVLFLP